SHSLLSSNGVSHCALREVSMSRLVQVNGAQSRQVTGSDSPRPRLSRRVPVAPVKILVLTNLYPPHHAGTYDLRCQSVSDLLRLRGHSVLVLTSNHGLNTEQRDEEIHRRLLLNGAYGHALVTGLRELQKLEERN